MPQYPRILLLWLCTVLFAARVMGQIFVGIYHPASLPPWEEWYSGLLPYPWLLLSQIIILMLMAVVNTDHARSQGRFHVTSGITGRWLRRLAALYALAMLVRYALHMHGHPEARWFGGCIPIFFHLVLAAWLFLLSLGTEGRTDKGRE